MTVRSLVEVGAEPHPAARSTAISGRSSPLLDGAFRQTVTIRKGAPAEEPAGKPEPKSGPPDKPKPERPPGNTARSRPAGATQP